MPCPRATLSGRPSTIPSHSHAAFLLYTVHASMSHASPQASDHRDAPVLAVPLLAHPLLVTCIASHRTALRGIVHSSFISQAQLAGPGWACVSIDLGLATSPAPACQCLLLPGPSTSVHHSCHWQRSSLAYIGSSVSHQSSESDTPPPLYGHHWHYTGTTLARQGSHPNRSKPLRPSPCTCAAHPVALHDNTTFCTFQASFQIQPQTGPEQSRRPRRSLASCFRFMAGSRTPALSLFLALRCTGSLQLLPRNVLLAVPPRQTHST